MPSQLGRFTVQAEIGRGAMGVVYKGMHPGLDVPVAIKLLADTYSKDSNFRARFQREAAMVASLNHPGIVRVYDFDAFEGSLFIVMEYVDGRSLRSWLNEYGRFTVEVANDLILQMLSAVGAAHARGIVHRDLKPDNILISTQGKTKILDFGISKVLDDRQHLTATGSMVGTPAYMSPEQVKGAEIDARSDIYALGVIFYELMHGQPPFMGAMPSVVHAHVFDQPRASTAIPPRLMELILKAMAKDPTHRFQTCEEFAGAVQYLPAELKPPPPEAPPPRPSALHLKLPRFELPHLQLSHGAEQDDEIGGCSYTGCRSTDGWQCGYVDARGSQCPSWWCKNHIVFMDATPFCLRHSNVLKALQATAGTIREIKQRPTVADRALPLAAMVAADLDKDLTELLRRRFQGRKDVRLTVDKVIRQTWEGRTEVAWERSWAIVQNQGYLLRIGIRVSAAEPDLVKVSIGNTVVFAAVPDWISRRREGEPPDHGDRSRFRAKVLDAVLAQVEQPTPIPTVARANPSSTPVPVLPTPKLSQNLIEGMALRLLATANRMTGFEIAERLALPYPSVDKALRALAGANFVNTLGITAENGPWIGRPLPERMGYSLTQQGRARGEELGAAGTRYAGAAPVSLEEYKLVLAAAAKPTNLSQRQVAQAMEGLEIPAAVSESIRAAVNSRGSMFIYGAPGNGKTSLARRLVNLLGGHLMVPIALDLEGDVMRVFDPALHKVEGEQPPDRRWRRVVRPLIQVGGEFKLEMLEPAWEAGSRTYEAPMQVKANGGVLIIDDLGRQQVTPKQILDRLLVPLEQRVDYMDLASSGRKFEVPFQAQLVFSTNMKPQELLDEAYLRRLAYKVLMPDPSWDAYCRIFERERVRLKVGPNPTALQVIQHLYGGRPMRGNHPRDLLERLVDVASARRVQPELSPELVEAAWQTLFVTT